MLRVDQNVVLTDNDTDDDAIAAHYEYDPYGHPIVIDNDLSYVSGTVETADAGYANANPFRFSTKWLHTEIDYSTTANDGLYYYGHRFYSPRLGRWTNRDPIGEQGGLNLYGFVGNNPISQFDSLGQYNQDTHEGRTAAWAIEVGYPVDPAKAIGKADNAVDGGWAGAGKGWAPIIGTQSYHFNRNPGGGYDTRMRHHDRHLAEAMIMCNNQNNDPDTAITHLGTALHSLQDWVAHGDYGIHNPGLIAALHNSQSPQTDFGNEPRLYPDDATLDAIGGPSGRPVAPAMIWITDNLSMTVRGYAIYTKGPQRITLTKRLTIESLTKFLHFVDTKGGWKCRCCFSRTRRR